MDMCDTKEVHKLLKCLNANKSCGIDKIPARLLKETADTSAVPLSMPVGSYLLLNTKFHWLYSVVLSIVS